MRRRAPPLAKTLRARTVARGHGRTSSAKTFQGFPEPWGLERESQGTREGVSGPANAPAQAAGEGGADALERGQGLLQLDSDLARPRRAQGGEQGGHRRARPWPPVGPLCPKEAVPLDGASMRVPGPHGRTVPRVLGRATQVRAVAGDAWAVRAQCTNAKRGHGSSLRVRSKGRRQNQCAGRRQAAGSNVQVAAR